MDNNTLKKDLEGEKIKPLHYMKNKEEDDKVININENINYQPKQESSYKIEGINSLVNYEVFNFIMDLIKENNKLNTNNIILDQYNIELSNSNFNLKSRVEYLENKLNTDIDTLNKSNKQELEETIKEINKIKDDTIDSYEKDKKSLKEKLFKEFKEDLILELELLLQYVPKDSDIFKLVTKKYNIKGEDK